MIDLLLWLCLAQTFDTARALQEAGKWTEAEQAYRALIRKGPATAEVHANLGAVLARLERYDDAIAQYRTAQKLAPALAPLHLNLGLAYFKSGRPADAIASFDNYLKRNPSHRQARQLRAMSLLEVDRLADAASAFAALLPSEDVSIRLGLATAYARMGKTAESRAAIEPVLARNDSAEAELILGQAMLDDGDPAAALLAFERAGRLNATLPGLRVYRGVALWQQRKTDEAMYEWRAALAANPSDGQPAYLLGAALAMSSRSAEAEPLLRRAIELKPRHAPSLYQLAKLIWSQSKSKEAAAFLERAISIHPNYREAHYLLGTIYRASGRREDAAREFAIVQKIAQEGLRKSEDLFERSR